jgi:hypothetical protein
MSVSDFYHIDCEQWADRFMNSHPGARKIKITPRGAGHPNARLDEILMPDGSKVGTGWFNHYAVLYAGRVYDEAYPRGISPTTYKERFGAAEYVLFDPTI